MREYQIPKILGEEKINNEPYASFGRLETAMTGKDFRVYKL